MFGLHTSQLPQNRWDGVHQLHHHMNHRSTHPTRLAIHNRNLGTYLPSLGTHLTCHQLSQCLGTHHTATQGSNNHLLSILWINHPNSRCVHHVTCNLWPCSIKQQNTDVVFLFSKTTMWWWLVHSHMLLLLWSNVPLVTTTWSSPVWWPSFVWYVEGGCLYCALSQLVF